MPIFRVSYTIEEWYTAEVEAENESEALELFHHGEYDNEECTGSELQDSVEVEEIQ